MPISTQGNPSRPDLSLVDTPRDEAVTAAPTFPVRPLLPQKIAAKYLATFLTEALADALRQATVGYWLQRADEFEWSAPRVGEYHGQSTKEQLRERWYACQARATACRRHAQLISDGLIDETENDEIISYLASAAVA